MSTAHLWNGTRWVAQHTMSIPVMKASELPAFMEKHGIPDAEISAGTEYEEDGPVVFLIWHTPAEESNDQDA